MLTIVIPYFGDEKALAALLINLQPQLHPDDDIYIVDSSDSHSGIKIAALYGTTRCYIFVEVGKFDYSGAWSAGFQSASENKQAGALILAETAILSATFISNLKKAMKLAEGKFDVLLPKVRVMPFERMDPNFVWFYPSTNKLTPVKQKDYGWLTPGCAFVSRGVLEDKNTEKKDIKVAVFGNETVIVLPYNPTPNQS